MTEDEVEQLTAQVLALPDTEKIDFLLRFAGRLGDERDRYRAALELIAIPPIPVPDVSEGCEGCASTAQTALDGEDHRPTLMTIARHQAFAESADAIEGIEEEMAIVEAQRDRFKRLFVACNKDRRFAWRELRHENHVHVEAKKEAGRLRDAARTLVAVIEGARPETEMFKLSGSEYVYQLKVAIGSGGGD